MLHPRHCSGGQAGHLQPGRLLQGAALARPGRAGPRVASQGHPPLSPGGALPRQVPRDRQRHLLGPAGLRQQLEAGLRPVPGPEEQLELERLWVQLLSALELFQQDLRRAHHLSQLFPLQGRGPQPLRTGIAGRGGAGAARSWRRASRKGGRILGAEQAGAGPGLEERVAQVGAMLTEMETSLNIPVWTVEATEAAWAERSSAAEAEAEGVGGEMPGGMEAPGHCCTVS